MIIYKVFSAFIRFDILHHLGKRRVFLVGWRGSRGDQKIILVKAVTVFIMDGGNQRQIQQSILRDEGLYNQTDRMVQITKATENRGKILGGASRQSISWLTWTNKWITRVTDQIAYKKGLLNQPSVKQWHPYFAEPYGL